MYSRDVKKGDAMTTREKLKALDQYYGEKVIVKLKDGTTEEFVSDGILDDDPICASFILPEGNTLVIPVGDVDEINPKHAA